MGHVMCPVTLPLVVAGDGGGCLKLRALAGRSLSVFLSLSIQAVAYLPVEYSSRARNGDRYGKEAEMYNELGCVSCSVLPFCFSDRPPKIFLPRRFYPEGTSHFDFIPWKPTDTWPRDRCGRAQLVLLPSLADFLHLGADL